MNHLRKLFKHEEDLGGVEYHVRSFEFLVDDLLLIVDLIHSKETIYNLPT